MSGKCVFAVYLLVAAWQDVRTRGVESKVFRIAGRIGLAVCLLERRELVEVIISSGIGLSILVLNRVTNGGIGEGDGWFFVVSGMYVTWEENLWLFVSGLCCCFLWSLPLAVKAILRNGEGRKRGIPFLPCLLPAGIWLVLA